MSPELIQLIFSPLGFILIILLIIGAGLMAYGSIDPMG